MASALPLLPFTVPCVQGIFLKRVKRFSVLCLVEGQEVWAHTNNSGSMLGLTRIGSPVLLSQSGNPNRKLPYTLELMAPPAYPSVNDMPQTQAITPDATVDIASSLAWVGVNTLTPNRLLRAAFEHGLLPWAAGYTRFTPEAKRGHSRLDALLEGDGLPPLWVECKNVTLVEDGVAAFPDAVTTRGHKHLQEMMDIAAHNERAAFFYCIQRGDAACFGPAEYVDPMYAELFYTSLQRGVEAYPYHAPATVQGIFLDNLLPLAPLPYPLVSQNVLL